MNSERQQQVQELYQAALALDSSRRTEFLSVACAGDGVLRREVEGLLASGDATVTQLDVGAHFGPYRLESLIGSGGMGRVYRALDTRLGRMVAIKVSQAGMGDYSEREARAISSLNHPNICTLYDVGPNYLVMEYVEGQSLRAAIQTGPLPVEDALRHAGQIAEALEHAHRHGVIHRDLKPGNVVLTGEGNVKILDFGLAKLRQPEGHADTVTAGFGGTPAYMSPEQAEGKTVDGRSDIFSFGAMLYELLSGRRPFSGDSQPALLLAIVRDLPPPLDSRRIPGDLARIVSRCLEKRPEDRYPDAGALRADLALLETSGSRNVRPQRSGWKMWAAVTAACAALAAGGWYVYRTQRIESARRQVREARQMADQGQGYEAARRVRMLRPLLQGDPELDRFWQDHTSPRTIRTVPSGADVWIKEYLSANDDWEHLGKSPVENLPMGGGWRARVTLDGYEPAEVAGSGEPILLQKAGTSPPGMVYVPAKTPVRFSALRPGAFWIERHEVTNQEFKRFVDAGGYSERKYWKEPFIREGRTLPWDQAMQAFRDATGRPGPSTWELGTYPEGRAQYPVSGVSWYEAAAYAAFAGKQLPTVFHYYAAAGAWATAQQLEASNFSGNGPTPVTANRGLTWLGGFDMAGNVREWCWNLKGRERFASGGAWNEPAYAFTRVDISRPPFDRAETNGFRCMKAIDPVSAELSAADPQTIRDFKKERPVAEGTYQSFLRMYAYDAADLNVKLESAREEPQWRVEKVSFDAAYRKDRVPAYLFLPKNATPPFQTVVYYPTLNAFNTPSSRDLEMRYISYLIQSGRAVLHPVYQGTYERMSPTSTPTAGRDRRIEISKDLRRSIDYLHTRPDIDSRRLAYYGYSQGALEGPLMTALEPRFRASILVAGGYYLGAAPLPEVDRLNFAPRVRVPTLMINGREDPLFPLETAQLPMFRDLGLPPEHKRHAVLDGGHSPTRSQEVMREALAWLEKYLGQVAARRNE